MLRPQPPTTRTSAPGDSARNGATARHASGRLSLALATAVGGIPSGSSTSIASANGTRTRSASAPPQSPPVGFMPYAAPGPAVRHEPVRPRVHRSHRPQQIWKGTTTRSPGRKRRTAPPVSTTSATNSWPIGKGPGNGTRPCTMAWSMSHVVTTSGRTSASSGVSRRASGVSSHRTVPGSTNDSCRMRVSPGERPWPPAPAVARARGPCREPVSLPFRPHRFVPSPSPPAPSDRAAAPSAPRASASPPRSPGARGRGRLAPRPPAGDRR